MSKATIPIGPQHPALHEPENFMIEVDGERIVKVTPRIGYVHRGIEKLSESRTWLQVVYLAERVCGICSHSHTSAYVTGVEELYGLEVPERGLYIRALVAELERIHSHLLWIGTMGHEAGWLTSMMYVWRDREVVMDILEDISGNRVNYAMNTIGGVRRDITPEMKEKILKGMDYLEKRIEKYEDFFMNEKTFLARLINVGTLPTGIAAKLNSCGPVARGCGVDFDVRRDNPYGIYPDLDFKVWVSKFCDLRGRVWVRIKEVGESIYLVKQILDKMPGGDIKVKRVKPKAPEGRVISVVEAPRGELVHTIISDGGRGPYRHKIRAPTYANLPSIAYSLQGGHIADIPVVIAGIDPCFSCCDRMTIIDRNKNKTWHTTLAELRHINIKRVKNGTYANE